MPEKRETEALLSLVRAGIYDTPEALAEIPRLTDGEWERVYDAAKRQTVSGVMCHALGMLDENQLPPYGLLLRWVARTHKIERSYRQMSGVLKELIELFGKAGLVPVLQKGHGVARFYPNPELRVSGDIDLCFNPGLRKMADEAVAAHGVDVRRTPDGGSHYRWNGTDVEHHTAMIQLHSPLHRSTVRRILGEQGVMQTEVAPGVKALVLSPLVDLLMINVHIMKHSFGVGIGLRQFCDYAMAYRALMPKIGEAKYAEACRKLGIVRWTDTLHRFVNRYLTMPDRELPYVGHGKSSAAAESLFMMVMEGGNFGLYSNKQRRGGKSGSKMSTLWSFVRHGGLWIRVAPMEALGIIMKLARGQWAMN